MVLEPDAVPLDAALFDFLKPIMEPYEYVIIDASSVGRSSDVLRLNKAWRPCAVRCASRCHPAVCHTGCH